jgi:hypothetical protein
VPDRIGLVVGLEDTESIDSALRRVSIMMTAGGGAAPAVNTSYERFKFNDDIDVNSESRFSVAGKLTQLLKKSMKDPST